MVRKIIKLKKASFTMQLPEEMMGNTVEVIAFEIDEEKGNYDRAKRLEEIEEITRPTLVDLSGYKFDRDRANDYGS